MVEVTIYRTESFTAFVPRFNLDAVLENLESFTVFVPRFNLEAVLDNLESFFALNETVVSFDAVSNGQWESFITE